MNEDLAYLLVSNPAAIIGAGVLAVIVATPLLSVLVPFGKIVAVATAQAWGG
jgi:hypothetical protein